MQLFVQHPGAIRMIDEFDKSVRILKAEDVPERKRFVYINNDGVEVDSLDQAEIATPIVEVRMIATDGEGLVVSRDKAQLIRIHEYGPEHRLLRSTTMTANKPPAKP